MTYLNFTFQDSSPLINYSPGQWGEGNSTKDPSIVYYSDKSFKLTGDAGATATLTFIGTSITLYGAKRPNHGNYSVVLDGGPAFAADGNSQNIFQFPLWNAQNLSNSQHTAVLTNVPTSSNTNDLDVDYVSIGREIGPPDYNGPIFDVTIEDESPFVAYDTSESWSPLFSFTASNSSLHETTEMGASLSLSFQGSSIELYGLYVNAPFQVTLDNQLPRELAGPDMSLENTMFIHPQTLLYYADGLDENQTHVVTLTNTVGDSTRPLYFDFAIVRSSQAFFGDTPSPNQGFTSKSSTPTVTTSAPNNTYSPSAQSHSISVGAVVGGVVGGVGGVAILAVIGFVFLCSRYRHRASPWPGSTEKSSAGSPHKTMPLVRSSQTQNLSPFGPHQESPEDPTITENSVGSLHRTRLISLQTQPLSSFAYDHMIPDTPTTARRLQTALASTETTSENRLVPPLDPPQELNDPRSLTQGRDPSSRSLVQTRLPPPYNPDWDDYRSS